MKRKTTCLDIFLLSQTVECRTPVFTQPFSWHLHITITYKKSLKIPKGQSEIVYRRRTDNKMATRKSTKGQTTIDKTKDRVTRTPLKTGVNSGARKG